MEILPQLLSASESLKLAIESERRKPHFASAEHDPCLAMWVAQSVRQENPKAFDLSNPADTLIWVFVRD